MLLTTNDTHRNSLTGGKAPSLEVNAESFSMCPFPDHGLHTVARAERRHDPNKVILVKMDTKLNAFFDRKQSLIGVVETVTGKEKNDSTNVNNDHDEMKSDAAGLSNSENLKSSKSVAFQSWGNLETKLVELKETLGSIIIGNYSASSPATAAKNPAYYDKDYYSPRDLERRTSWNITSAQLSQLRSKDALTPMLWIAVRAMYALLYFFHETKLLTDSEVGQAGGAEEEQLWDALRLQILKFSLTPRNLFTQLTWTMVQQLLTHATAIISQLSLIPEDKAFCRAFPESFLPLLRQVVMQHSKTRLFDPEVVRAESEVGAEICAWVRHVAAVILATRKGDIQEEAEKVRSGCTSLSYLYSLVCCLFYLFVLIYCGLLEICLRCLVNDCSPWSVAIHPLTETSTKTLVLPVSSVPLYSHTVFFLTTTPPPSTFPPSSCGD